MNQWKQRKITSGLENFDISNPSKDCHKDSSRRMVKLSERPMGHTANLRNQFKSITKTV